MKSDLLRKITVMLLAVCMVLGSAYVAPSLTAKASTSEWNSITDGNLPGKTVSSYSGVPVGEENYVKSVTVSIDEPLMQSTYMNGMYIDLIYDYDETSGLYHSFSYRFGGDAKVYGMLCDIDAEGAYSATTNTVTANPTTLKSAASGNNLSANSPLSSMISTDANSNKIVAAHKIKIVYNLASPNTVTFELYDSSDTKLTSWIVTNSDETTNYCTDNVAFKLRYSGTNSIPVTITKEVAERPTAQFTNWNNIDASTGVATTESIITHKQYNSEDNQYLSSAELTVSTSALRGSGSAMYIIYDYQSAEEYSFFNYRFTDSGYIYGTLGKVTSGVAGSTTDSGKYGVADIKTNNTQASIGNGIVIADVGTTGYANNYKIKVEYTSETTVRITLINGSNAETTVSIDITSNREGVDFTSDTHKFAMWTNKAVTFADPVMKYVNASEQSFAIDSIGATIAVNFAENVPIRFNFDYSEANEYLAANVGETLVNYGAVLVSSEDTAENMQAALKTMIASEEDKLTGTSYSTNKKYMFTAGNTNATNVPEDYYVTILSSDNTTYMDKNISAMGYIVTEKDGELNYYFTANEDNEKSITEGVIQKSVTSLLQVAGNILVTNYNTQMNDSQKTAFVNLIAACKDENGVAYTFDGYQTAVNANSLNNNQKELLKYVHLNVSSLE